MKTAAAGARPPVHSLPRVRRTVLASGPRRDYSESPGRRQYVNRAQVGRTGVTKKKCGANTIQAVVGFTYRTPEGASSDAPERSVGADRNQAGAENSRWKNHHEKGPAMKATWLAIASAATLAASTAGAALMQGDVAVVMANADGNDGFAWVALKDITANTVLKFTDSSYGNGDAGGITETMHRWTEHLDSGGGGPLTWTHGSVVTAGTVITLDGATTAWSVGTAGGSRPNCANSGDQIFLYTGNIVEDVGNPSGYRGITSGADYLFGVNWANSGWLTTGAGTPNNSYIPAGLTETVHLGNLDNYIYTGTMTGTPAELLAAISNSANWTSNDTTEQVWTSGNFSVIPEPGSALLVSLGLGVGAMIRRRRMA